MTPGCSAPTAWGAVESAERGEGRALLDHLVARGLLDARDLVDGEVRIVNASRRNRNARVTTTLGRNYFVKQGLGAERSATVGREAALLLLAAGAAGAARLQTYLPTVVDWDAERRILVFELMPESRSLVEQQHRNRRWPAALATQAGIALAALHRWQPDGLAAGAPFVDAGPPGVLSLHRPDIGVFARMSGAGLEIVRIVQGAASIGEALDRLRLAWQAGAVIHGDLKWDNVVVLPAGGRRGPRLRLVDWELVQLGDPLWDVASFLSEYLDAWIASIPVIDDAASQAAGAQVPLERLQPAMLRFWQAYSRSLGPASADRGDLLSRLACYAAARLIQTTVEAEQQRAQLSNTGVLRLQVAQNMLQRPALAAASLFGIAG